MVRYLASIFLVFSMAAHAQNQLPWKNKKCAVVLTYDDGLNVHLDNAIAVLDSVGLKGTFYLTAYAPGSKDRIEDWKKAAKNGHELANHTLFHPCIGKGPGREWVHPERDMDSYSMERLLNEIRMTNVFLQSLDGKTKRTFAYPCGDMTVKGVSYVDSIKHDFVSARGVTPQMHTITNADLFNVGSYMIINKSGVELINMVKEAMKTNQLLVFLFHGVGGEHNLNVDLKAHSQLVHFLKENEKDVWVAPFLEVTELIKSQTVSH